MLRACPVLWSRCWEGRGCRSCTGRPVGLLLAVECVEHLYRAGETRDQPPAHLELPLHLRDVGQSQNTYVQRRLVIRCAG